MIGAAHWTLWTPLDVADMSGRIARGWVEKILQDPSIDRSVGVAWGRPH